MYSTSDVTIIIPTYCPTVESLDWFAECLESALEQGCPISIASDASPKPVGRIIDELWESRISYTRIIEHRGVSFARNVATNNVKTDLIFPLDCDDTLRLGAIEELVNIYDGTPLYSDVRKFGEEDEPHYRLLDFDCKHIYEKVGLASVGVLHSKKQWESIGRWNEHIDFYEDGEYNARLMLTYCGKHYPQPLINYRIHTGQRTRINKGRSAQQARYILSVIKEYPDMAGGCCGKGRKKKDFNSGADLGSALRSSKMTSIADLPGMQGDRVLAVYVGGKGGAKHYYKGTVTGYPYKVKYGDYYYVDPKDAKYDGDKVLRTLFIRVQKDGAKAKEVKPKSEKPQMFSRTPREDTVKKPVVEATKTNRRPLPDIVNLRWQREIRHMEFTPEEASRLLAIEKSGKHRVKVVTHLQKFL